MDRISESKLSCVRCRYNLTGVAIGSGCPECGEPIETSLRHYGYRHGAPSGVPTTSGAAVASMVVGICGLLLTLTCGFLALPISIVAIALGHAARSRIAARPDLVRGGGMAVAGLVLGYIGLAIVLLFLGLIILGMVAGSL